MSLLRSHLKMLLTVLSQFTLNLSIATCNSKCAIWMSLFLVPLSSSFMRLQLPRLTFLYNSCFKIASLSGPLVTLALPARKFNSARVSNNPFK